MPRPDGPSDDSGGRDKADGSVPHGRTSQMAWESVIDTPRRLTFTTVAGIVSGGDALDHETQLAAHPCFDPAFDRIIDLRRVDGIRLTPEEIDRLSRNPLFRPEGRRALIAVNPAVVGLAIVYGALAGDEAIEDRVGVFRTTGDAWAWLDRGYRDAGPHRSLPVC